mmetsp:Transcript_1195/g.2866  ORF Transcript_1195/g.2866 Transcript_1195/m.2866 type:complete len:254 (+) Transcript_1195:1458-2219(+)
MAASGKIPAMLQPRPRYKPPSPSLATMLLSREPRPLSPSGARAAPVVTLLRTVSSGYSKAQLEAPANPAAVNVRSGLCSGCFCSGPARAGEGARCSSLLKPSNAKKSSAFCGADLSTLRPFPRYRPRTPCCWTMSEAACCRLHACMDPVMTASRSVSSGAVAVLLVAPATAPAKRCPHAEAFWVATPSRARGGRFSEQSMAAPARSQNSSAISVRGSSMKKRRKAAKSTTLPSVSPAACVCASSLCARPRGAL